MSDKSIKYRSGYKYQLAEDYNVTVKIKPKDDVDMQFIALDTKGHLTVNSGYAWDGTSGPVIDTENNLRASVVHDALYQLMRKKKISRKLYKDKADKLFSKMCKEDGVLSGVANLYYLALKKFGDPSTDPKNSKKIQAAP